jgi:hypothetical protein
MPTLRNRLRSFWELLHRWLEGMHEIMVGEAGMDMALVDEQTRQQLQRNPRFNAICRIMSAVSDGDAASLLWRESRSDMHLIELEQQLRGLHAARVAIAEHHEKEE